jgi:hypothetical protein
MECWVGKTIIDDNYRIINYEICGCPSQFGVKDG